MKLPGLHLFEKKEKPQYFLAFILRDDKAIAIIFEEIYGKAKIIGKGQEEFTKSIEEVTEEELLDVCDKAISKAEEILPPGVETKKTIFGLKDEWIFENKIRKEYLDKLKKVSDELGLTPIGFLQTSEAILNLLKNEEGAPVTAILAEFSKNFVIVSVVKVNKIIESKGAEIGETEALTVESLLKHFQALEILPSRILLYGNESEKYLQQFLGHQWSKSLNFLHLPQAIALPDDLDVKGVLFGAASQLGFSVMADFIKRDVKEEMPPKEEKIIDEFEKQSSIAEALEDKEEIEIGNEEAPEDKDSTSEATDEPRETEEPEKTTITSVPEESFGFMEGSDVAKLSPEKAEITVPVEEKENEEPNIIPVTIKEAEHALEIEDNEESSADETNEQPRRKRSSASGILGKTSGALAPVFAFSKKGLSVFKGFKRKKIIVIPGIIIVLFIVLYIIYLFSFKATVVLTLDPKTQEQKQTVTFVQNSETNPDNSEIASELSAITEDGSTDTKATGNKDTGTPAKGSVTVCSRFTNTEVIPAETVITSDNNLSFTTDNSAQIASASADASADCSTTKISVTAKNLGKQYNLPAGTKFTVGNNSASDIIAKNDDPFSGGTSKQVVVVSKNDLVSAQTNLIKSLQNKAIEDLKKKIPSDKILLPELINAKIQDSSASKKVGDEASALTLKGTVSYDGVVYAKSDLISFAKALFKDKLTSDQVINDKSVNVSVENITNKNNELVANLNFQVSFLPKIENDKITAKISGMDLNSAINYLSNLPQVADVKINMSPNIPFLSNFLPKSSGNINIQTKE